MLLFVWRATIDLANVRPLSGDEVVILSITERLLQHGRLGTPMLEGFRGADDHYFVVLPGQNVWQLPFVTVFGMNVAAARLASVLAAAFTIAIGAALAWLWFGHVTAGLSALLLVMWRSGAADMDYGLPLLSVARSARYDISLVAWLVAAVLFLELWLRRPAGSRAFAAGAATGFAALTQFLGFFALPALVVTRTAARPLTVRGFLPWLVVGFLCALLPYGIFAGMHASDAAAQFFTAHAARVELGFGGVTAPLAGVAREPMRYLAALRTLGFGPWLYVIGTIPAFIVTVVLARSDAATAGRGTRVLVPLTITMVVQLALLEPTKAPVYGLVLYPFVCIVVARVLAHAFSLWTARRNRLAGGLAGLVLTLIVAEGAAVYVHDARAAPDIARYADIGLAIDHAASEPGAILGTPRWWWALRDRGYVPLWSADMRWVDANRRTGRAEPFVDVLRREGIRYVLVTAGLRADAARGHMQLAAPVSTLHDTCGPSFPIGDFNGYGRLELIEVDRSCLEALAPGAPAR